MFVPEYAANRLRDDSRSINEFDKLLTIYSRFNITEILFGT